MSVPFSMRPTNKFASRLLRLDKTVVHLSNYKTIFHLVTKLRKHKVLAEAQTNYNDFRLQYSKEPGYLSRYSDGLPDGRWGYIHGTGKPDRICGPPKFISSKYCLFLKQSGCEAELWAIPPLPDTSSWWGVIYAVKHRHKFVLTEGNNGICTFFL